MITPDFNQFLIDIRRTDAEERARLSSAIEAVKADIASIHKSRHEVQENLALTINEMRLDQAKTAENLASLVASVSELVSALKGNAFGSIGIVAQVADHEKRLTDMEGLVKEAQGMSRLIALGSAVLALFATWQSLQHK